MRGSRCRLFSTVRFIKVGFLVIISSTILLASDQQNEARELFSKARALSELRTPDGQPFRLEAHIHRSENGKVTDGEYVEVWVSPRQWRREIALGDDHYLQIADSADEKHAWVVEPDDHPGFARQIIELAASGDLDEENLKAPKVHDKRGAPVICVENKGEFEGKVSTCFDRNTNALQSTESSSHGYRTRHLYSQYVPFGHYSVPREIISESSERQLEFTITSLATALDIDSTLFSRPSYAELRPLCKKMTRPHAQYEPDPTYPDGESGDHLVVLQVVVGIDGKPHYVKVIKSQGPAFDESAVRAVEGWNFRAATCEGEAVPTSIDVEISYRLRP